MTLGWVYRSVPHLGDSYNLDLLKCISTFWDKFMYNYNKYYARSSKKKGEQVPVTVLPDATATVVDASPNHMN